MITTKALILAFLMGVSADFPGYKDRRYPTCNIVDFKEDEDTGSRHAIHKCKTKAGDFKCSDITLDDCVAVKNSDGSLFIRGTGSTSDYKTLAANCAQCSYYGYPMSLYCLCGAGDRPTLFEPTHVELEDVFTNNDGILANNGDSTHKCAAKEVKCP